MRYRCRSCKYLSGTECRRHPPAFNMAQGRAFPVVRDDDWCGEHKLERKAPELPIQPKKPAWPGARPDDAVPTASLLKGKYDGHLEDHHRRRVIAGLLECLSEAISGDRGRLAWTKTNLEPLRQALDSRMTPSYIAKACYGWLYDPSGWWNGKLEGERSKDPSTKLVVKHAIKFHRWYEEQTMHDGTKEERPAWLKEVRG